MSAPAAIALLLVVMLLVAASRAFWARWRGRLKTWSQLAEKHKLSFEEGKHPHESVLKGTYRGVRIEANIGPGQVGPPLRLFTRISFELPGASPPGLVLTTRPALLERIRRPIAPEIELPDGLLGPEFTVHGHELEKTLEVLTDPAVKDSLVELRSLASLVHLTEGCLYVEQPGIAGPDLPTLVDLGARAAAGVSLAFERAWLDFAREHGLSFTGAGTRGERVLRGTLRGNRVTIETGPVPSSPGMSFTTIRVSLGVRLPRGLRILARELSQPSRGEIELGVPKLDAMIRVFATNAPAATALLCHPQVRDHLVAFYEACPFTTVEGGQVVAGGPGLLCGDILGQVQAVEDLAQSFRDSWAEVKGGFDEEPIRGRSVAAR